MGSFSGAVIDGLDVVAVGVEDVRAVVRGVVLRPQTRPSVVRSAGGERRAVEGLDGRVIHCGKRDVKRRPGWPSGGDPKIVLIAVRAEAERVAAVGREQDSERR